MERDQYDLFLERIAKEEDLGREFGREGTREVSEEICENCMCRVPSGSRHCPSCGAFRILPEGVNELFKPKTIFRTNVAVTLLGVDSRVEIENRFYTRLHLKIRNLSLKRVHISLTYVDSVLVDVTGRQYSPVEPDEFVEDHKEPVFPTWFHVYPDAFKDGVLLFREPSLPLDRAIICAMYQENEDEMFVFELG
ncbi:MAG: hypothetical protein NTY09_09745 [bacterium]|nr:hypothetical protein [bacterium]